MSQTGRTRRTARIERVGPVATSSRPARRRSIASAALGALAMVLALLLAPSSAAQIGTEVPMISQWAVIAQDADEGYPGHPRFPGQGLPDVGVTIPTGLGMYISPQATGVNHIGRLGQWGRTPTLQTATFNRASSDIPLFGCGIGTDWPGASHIMRYHASFTLVNTAAAAGSTERFGRSQAFEVRALAFGALPVRATVVIEQPRSATGAVRPVEFRKETIRYCNGQGPFPERPPGTTNANMSHEPAETDGAVAVRVEALEVDEVPIALAGGCRSGKGALELSSTAWHNWDPQFDPAEIPSTQAFGADPERLMSTGLHNIGVGGRVFGILDIPAFSGCVTATGEDLSGLLTATVSGPGNRVEMTVEGLTEPEDASDQFGGCPFTRNCGEFFPTVPIPSDEPSGS